MRAEADKHDRLLQQVRAEAEHKLMLAEQALSRQASTAASVGSTAEASGFPSKIVPDYFQNLAVQPVSRAMYSMPATQTQAITEIDKNSAPSASQSFASQFSSFGPASTFASPAQEGAAQASGVHRAQSAGDNDPKGSGHQGPLGGGPPPPDQGQSPPEDRFPRPPDRRAKGGSPDGGGGGDGGDDPGNSFQLEFQMEHRLR